MTPYARATIPGVNDLSRVAAGSLATLALLLSPAAAAAAPGDEAGPRHATRPAGGPAPAKIKVEVKGLKSGKVVIGQRVEVVGTVSPFVPGQKVEVRLQNRGDVVLKKTPFVRQVKGKGYGRFKFRTKPIVDAGKYRAQVEKASDRPAGGRPREVEAVRDQVPGPRPRRPRPRGPALQPAAARRRATTTPTATTTARTPSAR